MKITTNLDSGKLSVALEGRLDTTTAPELDAEIKKFGEDVESMELDLKELQYMSSAGLRILLSCQKSMNKKKGMVIKNVNEVIMEVFEVTGMTGVLTIE